MILCACSLSPCPLAQFCIPVPSINLAGDLLLCGLEGLDEATHLPVLDVFNKANVPVGKDGCGQLATITSVPSLVRSLVELVEFRLTVTLW